MASRSIILELARPVRRRLQRWRDRTRDKTEFRRCQILLHWAAGQSPEQIAAALGCDVSTVYRTGQAFRERGEVAVRRGRSPGRPAKLQPGAEQALDQTLRREPRACGLNFSNWTAAKLALYLKLAVHAVTVLRHLWALGWRWRRPVPRIASPDPRYAAKARYLRRLRQQAHRGEVQLYYADELDVALLPTISGRWMRRGQQTEIDTPGQNAKQYVFGAVNCVTGKLHWVTWAHKDNVGFRQLLQKLAACHPAGCKIVVVADNFKIHKAKAVQAWLARRRSLLRLYFLPTYSPRLNPIERVWHHFRRNVTDNYFFKTMQRLLAAVESFLVELAGSPETVRHIVA